MIQLFDSENEFLGLFKNFEQLCDYLRRSENLNLSTLHKFQVEEKWDFVYYPHRRLGALYEHLKNHSFTLIENEAYDGEFDLIEIYRGDPQNFEQIIVTLDTDVDAIQRNWCFEYCHTHGYTVFEILDGKLLDEQYLLSFLGQRIEKGVFRKVVKKDLIQNNRSFIW